MIALRLVALSLLVTLAVAHRPSDPVKVCGAAVGRLFAHPACDAKSCLENWPRGRQISRLAHVLCSGDKTLESVMDLCCIQDANEMAALVAEAIGHADAPAPAVRSYVPRVPNFPHPTIKQNFDGVDDSIFNF